MEKIKKELEEKFRKQEEEMLASKLEETKEDSVNRGNTIASITVGNFTFLYGC